MVRLPWEGITCVSNDQQRRLRSAGETIDEQASRKRSSEPPPSRSMVGSELLQVPGVMIEVEAIASLGS
jgi:enamine deaminase RidA (YjgF/YER057c/UK114 family)